MSDINCRVKIEEQLMKWYQFLRWTEMQITWFHYASYELKQEIRKLGLYKQAV